MTERTEEGDRTRSRSVVRHKPQKKNDYYLDDFVQCGAESGALQSVSEAASPPDSTLTHGEVSGFKRVRAGYDRRSPERRLQHLGDREPAGILQDCGVSGLQGMVREAENLQSPGLLREEAPGGWEWREEDRENGGGEQPGYERADPGSVQQQRAGEAHLADHHSTDPEAAGLRPQVSAAGPARPGRAGGSGCIRILPGTDWHVHGFCGQDWGSPWLRHAVLRGLSVQEREPPGTIGDVNPQSVAHWPHLFIMTTSCGLHHYRI